MISITAAMVLVVAAHACTVVLFNNFVLKIKLHSVVTWQRMYRPSFMLTAAAVRLFHSVRIHCDTLCWRWLISCMTNLLSWDSIPIFPFKNFPKLKCPIHISFTFYITCCTYVQDIPLLLNLMWLWSVNSLGPSDATWRCRSGSILAQVMACCLTAPSHYLNQCWLIIS